MEELSFKLGADGSELPPELEKAKKGFKKFANDVTEELAKAGAAAGKSGQSAKAAGIQFQGFSRVMQDAAFGPAAIANNLEGLGRDMQQISQISKETGQSIGKTLVASLMGGGGLNLAIGGLTLAMSLASFGMTAWTRLFPSAKKELDDTAKKTKELSDSILTLDQVQKQGRSEASKEVSSMQSLYKLTQDLTIPQKERLKIAKDLIERYPDYLKGFTAEALIAGKAAGEYQKLTNAIYAKGIAQAGEENRQKLLNQKFLLEGEKFKKRVDLAIAEAEDAKKSIQLNEQGIQIAGPGMEKSGVLVKAAQALQTVNTQLENNRKELAFVDDLTARLVKTYGSVAVIDGFGDKVKKDTEKVTKYLPQFKANIGDMVSILRPLMDTSKTSTDAGLVGQIGGKAAKATLMETVALLEQTLLEMKTKAAAAYTDFVNTIGLNLSRTFGNFFADIVTQGKLSFKTLADGILGEFKRILANAITKKLLSLFVNFASGGGAGIFGKIFSFLGGGTGIPGFASGVQNFSGGLALVGENGPELVNLPGGSDVIPNNRMGGGGTQVFITKTAIRSGDIYISYERGARINRRVT